MTITKELRDNMAEVLEQANVSDKTARDILLICNNGLSARDTLKLRGVDNPNPGTLTDLKNKSQKWMLSSPDMQKLAHHAVRDTLKMKPVKVLEGEEIKLIYPSHTNRLAAASMVADRMEPVKQEHSARSITNNIQVNIRELDNPEPALDIVDMDPTDKLDK